MMLGGQGGKVALGVGIEEVNMSKLQLLGSQKLIKRNFLMFRIIKVNHMSLGYHTHVHVHRTHRDKLTQKQGHTPLPPS